MVDQKIETLNVLDFQQDIWERIRKISTSNRLGSAYLLYGPPGCGKEAMAIKFSQILNCEILEDDICGDCSSCTRAAKLQHENIKLIFPMPVPKKNAEDASQQINEKSLDLYHKIRIPMANRILIQSIRELRKNLYLKGDSKGRKVVLVFDAHLLSAGQGESANAFLKLLEEPPSKTTIILVTDHIELVLPSIISRCQRIGFPRLEDSHITSWLQSKLVQEQDIPFLVGLSRGNLHNAQFFISQSKIELEELIKNLVDTTTRENPEKWRKFIEAYSKLSKQKKDEFEYHFMLLRIWYQSVNRLKNNLNDPLHDTSLIDGMKRFLNSYPFADLLSIVSDLEDVVRAISMNLYMPLVLTNLLLETKKNLKQ